MAKLTVTEIYASIQGESTRAGLPCVFVRLTGCNLRCSYCDTAYAFHGGMKMTLEAILEEVRRLGIRMVEVTGGEPLLQHHTPDLCRLLLESDHDVLVETSGERPIEILPPDVIRIMDWKTPSSGESHRNRLDNLSHLTPKDEIKFVVGSEEDYHWMAGQINTHNMTARCTVLVSPVFGQIDPKHLVEWILRDKLDVRFQLQMHKHIWEPSTRSV